MRVSVVLDCHDPRALAGFWSAAMRYRHAGSVPGFEVLTPDDGEPPGPVLIQSSTSSPTRGTRRPDTGRAYRAGEVSPRCRTRGPGA